ncbi:YdhK family protein [Apilactobacillus kunkeei]|uniref:YdhK family protein n=1 Tax=Apilactobacillus kunkeei TaxID=148814 RepID=UPI00200A7FFA|nr:YdhK family protein [Apilactobacillus kunkeei]MCK8619926.1 YdhK family protein [Apilactobacillus kunkeei]
MKKRNIMTSLSVAALSLSLLSGVAVSADSMSNMHNMSSMKMENKTTNKSTKKSTMKMTKKSAKKTTAKKSTMKMTKKSSKKMNMKHSMMSGMMMDGLEMNMNSKLPKGLKKATHAKFHVGQKVTLKAKHMEGMYNAKATVAGVYKTDLYEIDFMPTNGGKMVKNHKWVVASELKAKGALKAGKKVTVLADHMYDMKGAKGKIVKVHKGPAYVVTFKDTKTNMVMKNHKWLTQQELKAIK